MSKQAICCPKCQTENISERYFCEACGSFLRQDMVPSEKLYSLPQIKMIRIIDNLKNHVPHMKIVWDDMVDSYAEKVEKYRSIMELPEMQVKGNDDLGNQMLDFLELCHKPEFQIAFVGVIKTGKSTLINSLLGHDYASMDVTPETAALTKFRSSFKDYLKITFYSEREWNKLWKSRTSGADEFMKEYKELNAEAQKSKWVGHKEEYIVEPPEGIERELVRWSSSKHAEHYFVKEIEVGISSLSDSFPKEVVFVDTPGLSDPVAYRSEITKEYIRKANAVFVCVDAKRVQKDEIETISSVFSFSSHNKNKVHIIATHWDNLNNPVEEWGRQKKWLEGKLLGPGFFEKEEMAHKNIMHAAAYIYNLCRNYDNLEKEGIRGVQKFALDMDIDPSEVREHLEDMMKLTNIDNIMTVINTELVGNYKKLLVEDIKKKYFDIKYALDRIVKDEKKVTKDIIQVSYSDLKEMEKRAEEQRKHYSEIKDCQEQLNKALATVKTRTQKRLDQILAKLKEAEK